MDGNTALTIILFVLIGLIVLFRLRLWEAVAGVDDDFPKSTAKQSSRLKQDDRRRENERRSDLDDGGDTMLIVGAAALMMLLRRQVAMQPMTSSASGELMVPASIAIATAPMVMTDTGRNQQLGRLCRPATTFFYF